MEQQSNSKALAVILLLLALFFIVPLLFPAGKVKDAYYWAARARKAKKEKSLARRAALEAHANKFQN